MATPADTFAALVTEATALGVNGGHDEESLDIVCADGERVCLYLGEDGITAAESGDRWEWSGTIAAYLAERAATNNWT